MPIFETLLHDDDIKVRMEAPEMFRVLGKRRPEYVIPYLAQLQQLAQTDDNDVVRIHCLGAVKAAEAERTLSSFRKNLSKTFGGMQPD